MWVGIGSNRNRFWGPSPPQIRDICHFQEIAASIELNQGGGARGMQVHFRIALNHLQSASWWWFSTQKRFLSWKQWWWTYEFLRCSSNKLANLRWEDLIILSTSCQARPDVWDRWIRELEQPWVNKFCPLSCQLAKMSCFFLLNCAM